MEAVRRKYLRRRKWWLATSNAMEELNYVRTKNYLGILSDLDKSYFSWNGGDKRLTNKDWLKIGDLVIPILGIYLTDIFLHWKNNICSHLFPEAFYISKQLKTINTCK